LSNDEMEGNGHDEDEYSEEGSENTLEFEDEY
jgi:hypothetical protein